MVEPSATQVKEAQLKYNKLFKPHSVDPMWHAHWEVILKQMNNPDFLIVNSDETEEGACHRCVLSGHSPQLADLVARSEVRLYPFAYVLTVIAERTLQLSECDCYRNVVAVDLFLFSLYRL